MICTSTTGNTSPTSTVLANTFLTIFGGVNPTYTDGLKKLNWSLLLYDIINVQENDEISFQFESGTGGGISDPQVGLGGVTGGPLTVFCNFLSS